MKYQIMIFQVYPNSIYSRDSNEIDTDNLKPQFLELLSTLKNEMNSRFNDMKHFRNAFRFIKNPW